MAVIQKRKDAKGNVRYRVLIRKAGNPTVSKTFSKWQTAKDFANKTESELEAGSYRAEKALLSDVINESYKVLSMSKEKSKRYALIDKHFGHFALEDLKREVFFAYVERRKHEVKPSTINNTFAYIHTLLKFAETYMQLRPELEEFKIARHWLSDQNFITKSERRTRRVTDEELRAIEEEWILDEYQGAQEKSCSLPGVMRFAILTAMRRGEQFTLRWDELDAEERTVGCWRKHPKGKVYSRVPLLAEAMAIIERQKRN